MIRVIVSNNDGEFLYKKVNFIKIDGEDFIINYQDEHNENNEEIGPIPGDVIVENYTELEMPTRIGDVSKLIADMTLKGATLEEIERVTNYLLKVIDLEIAYHNLDIEELVQKYGKEGQNEIHI